MCEAHEALTFWLLLGQAKSDKKRFIADALNDKLMVNGQLLIVMPGCLNANFANVVPAGEHKVRLYAAFRPVA